ncbi:MAG: 30S ribosomal protein S12 methylthiotransferase RimO [Candidatus Aminicenantes bacterium]|nr:30S ribosomal protein S12 methylthiotransferase RimO [Candidatus Aminicenantes bacterium]
MKITLISYGCAKNLVDSEVMLGTLAEAGYAFTPDAAAADILIVNTCGFIRPARDEADRAIRDALRLKRTRGPKSVVIAGCYVERDRAALAARYPEVDLWLGVKDFDHIVPALRGEPFRPGGRTFLYSHDSPRVLSTPRGWGYLKISEGCLHACAFCAIPAIKGPYRSRPVESIVAEAQRLAERGVREINIISQDTTAYGRDLGLKDGPARLLRTLVGVEGVDWIRLLYGYPDEVDDALLEAMADPKVCRYLDIPFQHAHPDILRRMGRGLAGPRALRLLAKIRGALPGVALRTSVIVGFPGEGRAEFEALLRFVEEARFDHLGVFAYSMEAGTPAAPLGDPVEASVKTRRKNALMERQAAVSLEANQNRVGQRFPVLFEGLRSGSAQRLIGRGPFQAPEVDGIIEAEAKSAHDAARLPGTIGQVEITAADVYDLKGKIIE